MGRTGGNGVNLLSHIGKAPATTLVVARHLIRKPRILAVMLVLLCTLLDMMHLIHTFLDKAQE